MTPTPVPLPTRRLDPGLVDLLTALRPGDRVRITQTVRVGARTWPAVASGAFRRVSFLATGTTTDRRPEDDIVVPTVHYTKDTGELASVTLDEHTKLERG